MNRAQKEVKIECIIISSYDSWTVIVACNSGYFKEVARKWRMRMALVAEATTKLNAAVHSIKCRSWTSTSPTSLLLSSLIYTSSKLFAALFSTVSGNIWGLGTVDMRWIFYEPISCVNRRFQERSHELGSAPTFLAFRRKSDGMLANAQN